MREPVARHYSTLFDSNYLLKGLALYRSLVLHGGSFVLHVLCMDDYVYDLLTRMALPGVQLIRRKDFEDPELVAVKASRTVAEYCWTCSPSLPLYVLQHNPAIDLITYVDADLMFFSTPEQIFDEMGEASIAIVEHRFAPRFAHLEVNGKFNVEWISFRRDQNGLECLEWWRNRCLEWCFNRLEDNRMGDQKYLDVWPEQFKNVHVIQHQGVGVAPWNYSKHTISQQADRVLVDDVPVVFFHYHGFRMLQNGKFVWMAEMYGQDAPMPASIYRPYEEAMSAALSTVRQLAPKFAFGIEAPSQSQRIGMTIYWHGPEWMRSAFRMLPPTIQESLRSLIRRGGPH